MPQILLLTLLACLLLGCGGTTTRAHHDPIPAGEASSEHLAWWGDGSGSLADAPATRGAAVAEDAIVAATDALRLYLAGCPGSTVTLSPGSRCRLQATADSLIIELLEGQLALDLADRGPWQQVLVRGAQAEAVVLGTLLNTERNAQGDFFMLVRGRVNVRLRAEVAAALGRPADESVELGPRQAVNASASSGFGQVSTLNQRPQLGTGTSLQQQASAGTGSGWNTDALGMQVDDLGDAFAADLSTDLGQALDGALQLDDLGAEDLNESLSESLLSELDDFPGQPPR